jgi:hypothetical protein
MKTFRESLPRGPLVDHLSSIHALLVHLGAGGDVRKMAEHHLREIAVFTMTQPWQERP